MLATKRGGRLKPSAPRRWSSSRRGRRFGQRLFAILFHTRAQIPVFCGFGCLRQISDRWHHPFVQPRMHRITRESDASRPTHDL